MKISTTQRQRWADNYGERVVARAIAEIEKQEPELRRRWMEEFGAAATEANIQAELEMEAYGLVQRMGSVD